MFNRSGSQPILTQCLFVGNNCGFLGGAIRNFFADPQLINCTLVGNSADSEGGAIHSGGFEVTDNVPVLTNCILWDNFCGNRKDEYAQISGGLGGAIAELLSKSNPKPIRFVGMKDKFGESGSSEELFKKYRMDIRDIIREGIKAFRRIRD